ncbi:MAG: Ig-like domain-containing protein, partial [Chloroflexi bacterium]|nr:Ig-like domain-containing protein [Chloroflexota bacterium]
MSTKCLLSLCLRLLLAVAFLAGCSTSPTATPVPKQDLTTAPTLAPKTAAAATPVLTREASPTSEATPTPLPPLPPTVIEREPARGALQPPDRPLVLTFDQPMDQASVEATFQIEPMVEGAFHWSEDGRTLTFQPKEALARGREYTVTIGPEARSRQGLTMGAPLRFRFQTVGYLEVTGVFPAPDSSDVAGDTTVRVIFNRPVVPLTAIGAQQELPQAVQFSPAVKGTGRWINTSIFDFQPTARLAPGTTYTATVPQNLTDLSGAPLQEAFTWSFRTELPAVISVEPPDGARYVSPTPTLRLSFNQPMDRASVEVRFTLTRAGSDQALRGTFTWQDTTAIFTPTVALERGADYVARLAEGASAATAGAGKAPAFEWHFAVAPEPRVSRIQPADGATRVPLGEGLHIEFTSPISREAFSKYLIIEPKAQYYPFWHDDDTQVELSTFLRPSTRYTVTLPSDIVDRFGTPLRQARTIHFETAPYDPMVFIRTQGRVGTYNAYAEPTIYVEYRNVSQVDLALYHLTPQSFVNLNAEESWRIWDKFRPQTTDLIRRWSREVDSPLNQRRILSQTLTTEEGRPLAPGLYYLEVSSPDRKQDIQKHLLVVTTLNLVLKTSQDKLLVWATDLKSGEPVADVSLMVYNGKGRQSSTMTTDAEGLALGPMPPQDPWSPIVVLARKGEAVSAVLRYWSSGISPWEFGLSSEPMRQEYRASFYTDRRIYRPGQKVYFK